MSSNDNDNDNVPPDPAPPPPAKASPAADVSFTAAGDGQAESSSQAASRSSSAKRSSRSITDRLAKVADRVTERRVGSQETPDKAGPATHTSAPQRSRKSGGFLLETVLGNGHLQQSDTAQRDGRGKGKGKGSGQNGRVQPGPSSSTASRASAESSQRSPPLSKEPPVHGGSNAATTPEPTSASRGLDPAQLVQMALSLSESRKRHVSSTLQVPISRAGGRRVVSALDSGYGSARPGPSGGRRPSHLGDVLDGVSPASQSHSGLYDVRAEPGAVTAGNVVYTFSPAALSRAEKARRYFELAAEHRRLLDYLPPLELDATAPGNHTVQAASSPGSAHYQMARVSSNTSSKQQLGRAYNPLQALRNRRLRNIARRPLTAPPDAWQETDRIRRWIDGVAVASKDSSYRLGAGQVRLPAFSGELEVRPASRPATTHSHRNNDTVSSVITRSENGWTIDPAEMLADTYWTERDDNKTIIEDRHGHRIVPGRVRTTVDLPRKSKESQRNYDSTPEKEKQHSIDESEAENRKRKKHKHTLSIPGRLRRHHVSRSNSISTESSEEGRKPPALRFGDDQGGDENVGPLERHMRTLIAKEARGELPSPELISPDHWDSKHTPFPDSRASVDQSRASMDRGHRQSIQTTNGRLSVDTQQQHGWRSRSTEGRLTSIDHGRGPSSMDELLSASPTSPVMPSFISPMSVDGSSPDHKQDSKAQQRSQGLKLPSFRSRSKERNKIEQTDFATSYEPQLSPVMSADTGFDFLRTSLDSTRPLHFRRHKTTDSNVSSLKRTDTATTATEPSAKDSSTTSFSRRFLKGGRVGDLVRNESSRFGDRFGGSREGFHTDLANLPSDVSDADDGLALKGRRLEDQGDTSSQVSPRASFERNRDRPKYFTSNLPSFKSPSGRGGRPAQTPLSDDSDPFEKLRPAPSRRGKFSRPAPLRIQLPDDGNASEPEPSPENNQSYLDLSQHERRKSASHSNLTRPNTAETTATVPAKDIRGYPVSGLASVEARPPWSISDQGHREQANKVTMRDMARVRALLLASGIKAHEIYNIGSTPRKRPLLLITRLYASVHQPVPIVPRCEENLVAARMLSEHLDQSTDELEHTIQRFQCETAKRLRDRLEELSHRAGDQLTKLVHETSDEADAFNVELTTKQPQDIKRVDDAVEDMFRHRRRQFRLVVNTGFKLLEWVLLGIMWWVWFVVVVINTCKKTIMAIVRVIKWLFSF